MKIGIAADHGGYEMKEKLYILLGANGHEVVDFGNRNMTAMTTTQTLSFPLHERWQWERWNAASCYADKLRAHLIIMGLHDSAHAGIVSHLDLATTYDVICQAGSPVLTVNYSSGHDLEARPTKVPASPLSETDGIRGDRFGATW